MLKKVVLICLTILILTSCAIEQNNTKEEKVVLLEERQCQNKLGETHICYQVEISCNNLAKREAILRVHKVEDSKGTVILTSGGAGTAYYGNRAPTLVQSLQEAGFQTVEVVWQGEFGWAQDNFGEGLVSSMCSYAEVVHYIEENIATNKEVMCATGNSGGSMQIGYGLSSYNLEEVFDFVILSGGPPTSDAVDACLLKDEEGTTMRLLDYAFGFLEEEEYCQKGGENQQVVSYIDTQSIVPQDGGEYLSRDFSYPTTLVSFVEGEKDQANTQRAQIYYDAITTEKMWVVLEGVPHNVHKDEKGAQEILDQMNMYCN